MHLFSCLKQENNMVKSLSEELKQQWKEKILKQRSSGISAASWCRQNGVPVYNFRYWQNQLFPSAHLSRSSFSEIHPKNEGIGIFLEYQGVKIHLSKHFDPGTLQRCLEVLKAC
jgi:hypothetical protein